MNTRERILETSLKMLNEQGVEPMTIRYIAKEMGISHGNLGYHFPSLDEIIKALYYKLVDELNEAMKHLHSEEVDLKLIYKVNSIVINKFYEYRFFLLDFVGICRRILEIKNHYQQLRKKRKEQELAIIQMLIKKEIFLKAIPIEYYEALSEGLVIVSDFWLSNAEILFEGTDDEKIRHYQHLFFCLFWPYLTPFGRKEYSALHIDAG